MTGIAILLGRDEVLAMEWAFYAGMCGVLISIKVIAQTTTQEVGDGKFLQEERCPSTGYP